MGVMNDMSNDNEVKGKYRPSLIAIPAPVVISPAPGSSKKSPVEFSGTGEEGWYVYIVAVPIDGTEYASAVVKNGVWSVSVDMDVRRYSAFAVQMDNRETSDWSDIFDFTVTP
jgi:hypothetical protein